MASAWLLHWPADLITGLKPIVGLTPLIGLDAYHLPIADFVIELLIVSFACSLYASTFAKTNRQRVLVGALWASLLASQAILDFAISQLDTREWNPSLAPGRWRPHVTTARVVSAQPIVPHGSCTVRLYSCGSET